MQVGEIRFFDVEKVILPVLRPEVSFFPPIPSFFHNFDDLIDSHTKLVTEKSDFGEKFSYLILLRKVLSNFSRGHDFR